MLESAQERHDSNNWNDELKSESVHRQRSHVFWFKVIWTLFIVYALSMYLGLAQQVDQTHYWDHINDECEVDEDNVLCGHTLTRGANKTAGLMVGRTCEDYLLNLSDAEIWDRTTGGNRIGDYCVVSKGVAGNACQWYVKGRPNDELLEKGIPARRHNGIPRSHDGEGTGCVAMNSYSCYFRHVDFLTDDESAMMCSMNHVANAAAAIRFGIRNGYCTDAGEPLICRRNDRQSTHEEK